MEAPTEEIFVDARWQMPQFPQWMPPWLEQPQLPIPDVEVPFVQSGWTMLNVTWHVWALYSPVEIEVVEDEFFLDSEKPMPEYPVWLPPPEPSYFNQDEEFPHLEIDRIDLPIWLPWRPIPPLDYFNDFPEEPGPEKFESPWQIPRGTYFMPEWLEQPKEPIPNPEGGDVPIPSMAIPNFHAFIPDSIVERDFEPVALPLGSPPPKCPPPCLRRPDRKC